MLEGAALKEHTLNRLGYGPGVWQWDRYDELGFEGYLSEQLGAGTLPELSPAEPTVAAKVERAVLARRQLEAVLLDFWFNHFNVEAGNGLAARTLDLYQNELHSHMLGSFGDLLVATARSPAMLDYLDNRFNSEEEIAGGVAFGLNENYARELMELHTLGVDGGYREGDVIEVARVLTGWSVRDDRYLFKPRRHDAGSKEVMGVSFPAGRYEEEGFELLAMLAGHRSTASFISRKLCRRLVSENAPASAVDAGSGAFTRTDGDLTATVRAIVESSGFTSAGAFRSKVKPPHRYLASAVMAMGATAAWQYRDIADQLLAGIEELGEEPYRVAPPTGYPESSAFWVSSSTMLARFQLAEVVAGHQPLLNRLRTTSGAAGTAAGAIVDAVSARMCPGGLSAPSRAAAVDYVRSTSSTADGRLEAAARIVLSSPEFMRY